VIPCLSCGAPSERTRCGGCQPAEQRRLDARRGSFRQRGYDSAWDRLSRRARRLQPFCGDCGSREHLTVHHLQWPATRLAHVEVLCSPCNNRRGPRGDTLNQTYDVPTSQPSTRLLLPEEGHDRLSVAVVAVRGSDESPLLALHFSQVGREDVATIGAVGALEVLRVGRVRHRASCGLSGIAILALLLGGR